MLQTCVLKWHIASTEHSLIQSRCENLIKYINMKSFKKKFILTKKTTDMLAFELENPELVAGGKIQTVRILTTKPGGGCGENYVWSTLLRDCRKIAVISVNNGGGKRKG